MASGITWAVQVGIAGNNNNFVRAGGCGPGMSLAQLRHESKKWPALRTWASGKRAMQSKMSGCRTGREKNEEKLCGLKSQAAQGHKKGRTRREEWMKTSSG